MTNEIKITPDMKLPDVTRQLDKLGAVKNGQELIYIDEGDGVRILYGKPGWFSKNRLKIDPNKIRFRSKSQDGKGTTYGEYAEMKAKSILFEIISRNKSEESAALTFGALGSCLFQKDSLLRGDNSSREMLEHIIAFSSRLHRDYFDRKSDKTNLEERRNALHRFQQALFQRDSTPGRVSANSTGYVEVDAETLADALKIEVRTSKAKKGSSAAPVPLGPQQPRSGPRGRSTSLDSPARKKSDAPQQHKDAHSGRRRSSPMPSSESAPLAPRAPLGPARKSAELSQRQSRSAALPSPRKQAARPDTPASGPAYQADWHAEFDFPWGQGEVHRHREDLAKSCRQLAIAIKGKKPELESTVNYRFHRILASADERRELESAIREKLQKRFAARADRPDSVTFAEAKKIYNRAVKRALRQALTKTIPEDERQFAWPKFLSKAPIWSDTMVFDYSTPSEWRAQFDVPTGGDRKYAFAIDLKDHCQKIVKTDAGRRKRRRRQLQSGLDEILASRDRRLQVEWQIYEKLKSEFENVKATPDRKAAAIAKQKATQVIHSLLRHELANRKRRIEDKAAAIAKPKATQVIHSLLHYEPENRKRGIEDKAAAIAKPKATQAIHSLLHYEPENRKREIEDDEIDAKK